MFTFNTHMGIFIRIKKEIRIAQNRQSNELKIHETEVQTLFLICGLFWYYLLK